MSGGMTLVNQWCRNKVDPQHVSSMDPPVLFTCITIAEADEKSSSDAGDTEGSVKSSVGDASESGEIVPGKSVVFASLEVCLCALVRHLPALNPSLPPASVLASSARQTMFTDTTYQLLSSTLLIMADLPSLCSPTGLCLFLCEFFCFRWQAFCPRAVLVR